MIAHIELSGKTRQINLNEAIDISIPLSNDYPQVNCFDAPLFNALPLRSGEFVGSTLHGSPVNFYNVMINPHGNGTHTECVGHISSDPFYINECYKPAFHIAQLISVFPQLNDDGDKIIPLSHLEQLWDHRGEEALIIRTLPNQADKLHKNYSGTNPPYLTEEAMRYIVSRDIKHLLLDLPSVDREVDGGKVNAHKIFWNFPGVKVRSEATITELIFVPDTVIDGIYLLSLQLLNIRLDVSPSRPVLYKLL